MSELEERMHLLATLHGMFREDAHIKWRVEGNWPVLIVRFPELCLDYRNPASAGKMLYDAMCTVEQDIYAKQTLKQAAGAIDTLLRKDEFPGPRDITPRLRRRCDTVIAAVTEFELPGFPADVFRNYDFDAPEQVFETAQSLLLEASAAKQGRTLLIEGLDALTARLKTANGTMLVFDPIKTYYTGEPDAKRFRQQCRHMKL